MTEPVTTLTDFALALLAWWFAWRLRLPATPPQRSRRLWAWGLGVQGMAALLGGVVHGFFPEPGFAESVLWRATLIFLAGASTLLVSGLGVAVLPPGSVRILVAALGLKLIAYIVWVWPRNDFFPALCDQACALVLLAALSLVGRRRLPSAALNIALGLVALVAGGVIQFTHFSLHRYFNHNDIYHVFGALSLWFFFRAGQLLRDHDRESSSASLRNSTF